MTVTPLAAGTGKVAVGAFDGAAAKAAVLAGGETLPLQPSSDVEATAGDARVRVENSNGVLEFALVVPQGGTVQLEPARLLPGTLRLSGLPAGAEVRVVIEGFGEQVVELARTLPKDAGEIDPETGLRIAPAQDFAPLPGGNGGVFVHHAILGDGATNVVLQAGATNTASFTSSGLPGTTQLRASWEQWKAKDEAVRSRTGTSAGFGVAGGLALAGAALSFVGASVADTQVTGARADAITASDAAPPDASAVDSAWENYERARKTRAGTIAVGAGVSVVGVFCLSVSFGTSAGAREAKASLGPWRGQD
jgi:hypothetical protein